jgi:hypothetical protein
MFADGAFESRLSGRIAATKFGMIRSLGRDCSSNLTARRRLFKSFFRNLAPLTCIAPHFLRRRAAVLRFPDTLSLS